MAFRSWITGARTPSTTGSRRPASWVPARRRKPRARARSTAWNVPALERLIRRFALEPAAHLDEILMGRQSVRSLARDFLASADSMEASSFVRRAYEVVFDRPVDDAGLAFYTGQIRDGLPRGYVMDCLIAAPELRGLLRVPVGAG